MQIFGFLGMCLLIFVILPVMTVISAVQGFSLLYLFSQRWTRNRFLLTLVGSGGALLGVVALCAGIIAFGMFGDWENARARARDKALTDAVAAEMRAKAALPPRWRMAGGGTLTLDHVGNGARLLDETGRVIDTLHPEESVREAKISPDGTCLLLVVFAFRSSNRIVSHYSCLVRVTRNEEAAWHASRLLEVDTPPMVRRAIWKVGEIAPDGRIAKLSVAETTDQTRYAWEQWDLVALSLIGRGAEVR